LKIIYPLDVKNDKPFSEENIIDCGFLLSKNISKRNNKYEEENYPIYEENIELLFMEICVLAVRYDAKIERLLHGQHQQQLKPYQK